MFMTSEEKQKIKAERAAAEKNKKNKAKAKEILDVFEAVAAEKAEQKPPLTGYPLMINSIYRNLGDPVFSEPDYVQELRKSIRKIIREEVKALVN